MIVHFDIGVSLSFHRFIWCHAWVSPVQVIGATDVRIDIMVCCCHRGQNWHHGLLSSVARMMVAQFIIDCFKYFNIYYFSPPWIGVAADEASVGSWNCIAIERDCHIESRQMVVCNLCCVMRRLCEEAYIIGWHCLISLWLCIPLGMFNLHAEMRLVKEKLWK